MASHRTFKAQAQFLERRDDRENLPVEPVSKSEEGPTGEHNMIHCHNDEAKAHKTQMEAERVLSHAGLVWEDVESVIPMPDILALYVRPFRLRTWNHPQIYTSPRTTVGRLRQAVEICLSNQPLLRTMASHYDDQITLYLIMRPTKRWFEVAITEGHQVEELEDLTSWGLDTDLDFAAFPGPLFRIMIVQIKNTDTVGLIYHGNHAVFDALSIPLWLEDLDTALRSKKSVPQPRADFNMYARIYYESRNHDDVNAACTYHYKRLRGITHVKEALWPPRRAPQWFKGNDQNWIHTDGTPGHPSERKELNNSKDTGLNGIRRSISLPSLPQLKQTHNITAQIVIKAACALLNVHCSQQQQAIFSQYEAGRSWPLSSDATEQNLPNMMDIAGPTMEQILNRISVTRDETVSAFLERLRAEQIELTRHAHAPFRKLQAIIAADEDLPGDALFDDICRRQVFNWLPNTRPRYEHLQQVLVESRSDLGLQWNCMQVDQKTVEVHATFDGCQLRLEEVEVALGEMLEAAGWVASLDSWLRMVGECPLLNKACRHVRSDGEGRAVEVEGS